MRWFTVVVLICAGRTALAQTASATPPAANETLTPAVVERGAARRSAGRLAAEPAITADDASSAPDEGGDSFTMSAGLDDVGPQLELDSAPIVTLDEPAVEKNPGIEMSALLYARAGTDLVHQPGAASGSTSVPIGEDVLSFRGHARAEATSRYQRMLKLKLSGRLDAEWGMDADSRLDVERYEARLGETYVDYFGSGLSARAGNQVIVWGTAELITPNDVVNPRDLRRGFLERADELRQPVVALEVSGFHGPAYLTGVWVPVPASHRMELLNSDFALLGPSAPRLERSIGTALQRLKADPELGPALAPMLELDGSSSFGIQDSELGASAGFHFRHLDLLSYFFWGHERSPRIVIAEELATMLATAPAEALTPEQLADAVGALARQGVVAVASDYPRRVHTGGALATRLEPIGIKLDVGYTFGATAPLTREGGGLLAAESRQLDRASGTVSLDYQRGAFMVVAEGNVTRVLGVPAGADVYQMHGASAYLAAARIDWRPAASAISMSLLSFVDVATTPSYAVRPAIRFSGHDHISLEAAAILYEGPPDTLAGAADRNDEVVLTVELGL